MSTSQITLFREQQALEEAAARQGLDGFATVARHEIINARTQRGAQRILGLIKQGQHEQAIALMEHPSWGEPAETAEHQPEIDGEGQA